MKISLIQPSRNNLKYLKWSYDAIRKNQENHEVEICVADESWFISFTKKYKCEDSINQNRKLNFLDAREYQGVQIKLKNEKPISDSISIGEDLLSFKLSNSTIDPPHTTLEPLRASNIVDRGKYLVFGNYFKTDKGAYIATLKYKCSNSDNCGEFDFAVNKGKNIIFSLPLTEENSGIIKKSFVISSNQVLFGELRVKYENGELEIHDMSITKTGI